MQRQRVPEVMDDETLALPLHEAALRGLARINALSGTAGQFWKPLAQFARAPDLAGRPLRVLDLATGGSDVLLTLAARAKKEGAAMTFAGCDKSTVALEFAARASSEKKLSVEYFKLDLLRADIPAGFHVLINSLFLHHFDPDNVVAILGKARAAAPRVLVSDLCRSRVGLILAHTATRLLSSSPVVHVDGPRSVHGAFTISEMRGMAARAGMTGAQVVSCWPCRMLLSWEGRLSSRPY